MRIRIVCLGPLMNKNPRANPFVCAIDGGIFSIHRVQYLSEAAVVVQKHPIPYVQ